MTQFFYGERGESVGRVSDLGSKGFEFETLWGYCIVSMSKTLYPLLSIGSTQEDRKSSRHDLKLVDWDVKHQHNPYDSILRSDTLAC